MPEAIAPPEPKPAPPAAPSSPAPASTPPASPAPTAAPESPFAKLDAKIKLPEKAPAAAPAAPAAPAKGAAPAKPASPAPTGKEPVVPRAVREQFEGELSRLRAEIKTKSEAESALQKKIADYEARGKDTEALVGQLTTLQKAMEEKDAELRALKQEASPEFKKRYDEPFNRLADRAKSVVEAIQIEDTETGQVRTATWDDFRKLYGLNEFLANKEAKRIFGEDGAPVAMRYYMELHRLDDERNSALTEERAKYKEKDEAERATLVQRRQQIDEIWQQTNKELAENIEDYHDPVDDKELADLRTESLSLYDAAPKTIKEKIVKDAHIRQRFAAFAPMKLKLLRLQQQLADRDAKIAELEGTTPDPTKRPGGGEAKRSNLSWEEEARKTLTP